MERVSGRPRAFKVKGRLAACPQLAGLPVYHRHTSCITKLWDLCRPNDDSTVQGKSWSQKSLVFLGLHHMDWLTDSADLFEFTHFCLHLSSLKSWWELLLQEITPAPCCLMESPTRTEFRVYTLILRTFGVIFKARKRKFKQNARLTKTVFCPEGDTEVQGICEPFSKGLSFCHPSVNGRRRHLRWPPEQLVHCGLQAADSWLQSRMEMKV